jgi:hypothetical protein
MQFTCTLIAVEVPTETLPCEECAFEFHDRLGLDENGRTFNVEIGYEAGLSFKRVAGKYGGGTGDFVAVHPHAACAAQDCRACVRRPQRERKQE